MEPRRIVHQSDNKAGGMVSHRGITDLSRLPLLPFERELVATLGCTEAEYRAFTIEAMKRSRVRPAEYDHVPDIVNDAIIVPLLISLAVGLVTSAISYLLMPKPKAPKSPGGGQITGRQLPSVTGADRFSATSGFDTQAELANYGDPIPIIFGKYTGATGGILASPRLVWSRAFSYGSQQGVKLLMVVGEQGLGEGINGPELNGIFLGNSALDAIYSHNFAFYWKRNSNTSTRIRAANLAYGTRGTQYSGDTQIDDDIFITTTIAGLAQPGFCQAYALSANVQFGAYSGTPNGTDYRVNWKLVPIPFLPEIGDRNKDDPKNQRLYERIKIAGDYGLLDTTPGNSLEVKANAQKGIGRGYGRRMGITSVNGQAVTGGQTEVRQVGPGDTAVFTIAPGQLPEELYYVYDENGSVYEGTKVTDINSEISSARRAADELLQIGDTIMIGRTVWVIEKRSVPSWDIDLRQNITLRCVETFGTGVGASIGLISEYMLARGVYNDDQGATNARGGLGLHAGPGFFPLLRVAFGVVRNTNECEVTEIGIRSQVWNRANGLCNFSGLPSVQAFRVAEANSVGIESGTMTLYMKRTSVWTIFLRPAAADQQGNEYPWAPLGEQFCITGESPQDQFNFIRITHPEKGRYEFRMVPLPGAVISRFSPDEAVFWRLDAKRRQSLAGDYSTEYGTFKLYVIGELVTKKQIAFNPEMLAGAVISDGVTESSVPNAVEVATYLPDTEDETITAVGVEFPGQWLPDGVAAGAKGATLYELFGQASSMGLVKTVERTVTLGGAGRSITIRFTGIVNENYSLNHPEFPGQRAWNFKSDDGSVTSTNGGITVVSSSGGFNTGQFFDVPLPVTPGNPRALPYGLTTCGVRLVVIRTSSAVQPRGRESAWDQEIFGSAQAFSIGYKASAPIEVTSSAGGTATVTANAFVTSREPQAQANFPGQTQAWDVKYTIDPATALGTWSINTTVEAMRIVSAGNPFKSAGTRVGIRLRVLSLQTVVFPPGFSAERAFEENSQINDISFYNSLLTKSNESGPEHEIVYVNESVSNAITPQYTKLTLAGLALKASRNFTSLNQLRIWLADGISVRNFQLGTSSAIGPSNKFTDLVYYLLTDKTAGAGNIVSPDLIDEAKFPATSQFLEQNKLFFDGAIDQPTNIRQFISDLAPFFLCSFVISNGQFSIVPAVPFDESGNISVAPIKIQQLFTSGNIIEDSFSVEYLSTEERKNFQAVMRYRQEQRNQFPEEKTLVVGWSDLPEAATTETFDMVQYCTSRQHAFTVAKYFLSLRRRVTHTVRFRTTPYGLDLAPGDYIRVITQASPYNAANNGVVDSSLNITSVTPLAEGTYTVAYWNASFDDIKTETMTVANGKAVEAKYADAIFTLVDATVASGTYMVEQLTLSEEGMVDIAAVEFPTTSTFNSLIALDVQNDGTFTTEG